MFRVKIGRRPAAAVERRHLVGVLAVTERPHALEPDHVHGRRLGPFGAARQLGADRRVVGRGAREGLERPAPPLLSRRASALERPQDLFVLADVVHRDHVGEILGRRPKQRDAADVDLLHRARLVEPGRSLLEGIERHRHEIDRLDTALRQRLEITGLVPARQDRRVDVRMQRLHAAPQHLGGLRPLLDARHGHAGVLQMRGRAARGEHARAVRGERARELDDPALVGEREERGARPAHRALRLTPALR